MYILSIYPGHNSTVTILKDSEILINLELERYTRIKHDYGYSEEFVKFCLDKCNLTIDDIDYFCINTGIGLQENTYEGKPIRPFNIPNTADVEYKEFEETILGKRLKGFAINHHIAHASTAFFLSNFHKAVIYTQDGGGDIGPNGMENSCECIGAENKIYIKKHNYKQNLCGWWSSITFNNYRMPKIHRFDPGSGAGKIMGLAAYGKNYYDQVPGHLAATNPHVVNGNMDLSDTKSQLSQDTAYSLQKYTCNYLKDTFDYLYVNYGEENICYAGGLALNCVANTFAFINSSFKDIFVPPCSNDTGLALGMGLYLYYDILDNKREIEYFKPYTGPRYEVDPSLLDGYEVKKYTMDDLVNLFVDRNVVCTYLQHSECGPRALGHRSILCLPVMAGIRDGLNFNVKMREWYRPYAPIIIKDKEILEDYIEYSPYMITSGKIKKQYRDLLSGVNHVDNSTRPQILREHHDNFLYQLIKKVTEKSGVPAMLNTSFNLREPIVETPEDAVNTFEKFPIKYMILDNYLLTKKG